MHSGASTAGAEVHSLVACAFALQLRGLFNFDQRPSAGGYVLCAPPDSSKNSVSTLDWWVPIMLGCLLVLYLHIFLFVVAF